ncbi:hypothetical protein ANO11243_040490 [Dothideomycetidae sp. 11243]|nr:hypothetical protein ANO11243_040490 [fungal sp. No.11243]
MDVQAVDWPVTVSQEARTDGGRGWAIYENESVGVAVGGGRAVEPIAVPDDQSARQLWISRGSIGLADACQLPATWQKDWPQN